jgi:diguanylate cyclase (GGDEF)-like protein
VDPRAAQRADLPWDDIVERSPVASLLVEYGHETQEPGHIIHANESARALLWHRRTGMPEDSTLADVIDESFHAELRSLLASQSEEDAATKDMLVHARVVAPGTPSDIGFISEHRTLRLRPTAGGFLIVQLVQSDGWNAVDRVLAEQQRFRSALLELSELAHTTKDDCEFYQRLIERTVEVVPGAQGGSVQLNIEGTASFRFVSAVGYDLEGLQLQTLEQENFFRNAVDPAAQIVRSFEGSGRSAAQSEWLETYGRLSEIVVNVSAPVIVDGLPVAFLSLDNFEDPDAITETSVEMTTVLSRLIGDLWRRRLLETELHKEREAFRHQALHDPLTSLPNRRNLNRCLADAVERSNRRSQPSAVLFVDIDDFKGVNDRLGHEMGDLLLMGVADGLSDVVRSGDVVGRWGGDEFLVLPHRFQSPEEVEGLAERILERFETDLELEDGLLYRARLTVGIGWSSRSQTDADSLVNVADEALYEAKAAGKGIYRFRELLEID